MSEDFGMNHNADYSTDSLPTFPDGLKGNSAEGFDVEGPMKGYGKHSVLTRENAADPAQEGSNPPGAFIQGNNAYNDVAAGSPGHSEGSETPADERD